MTNYIKHLFKKYIDVEMSLHDYNFLCHSIAYAENMKIEHNEFKWIFRQLTRQEIYERLADNEEGDNIILWDCIQFGYGDHVLATYLEILPNNNIKIKHVGVES